MMNYPDSKKQYFVEKIFGQEVEDSYRWMEDETDKRLEEWIDEQNRLTHDHLASCDDREAIGNRLEALYDYAKYESIRVIGPYIIYSYNDGLQNQSVYYIQKGIDGEAQVLLDPNTLSDDGTVAVVLNGHSKDKRYLSYLQSSAGSDWHILRIIDLETLEILEDQLEWVKFTLVSWQKDGFYYSAFDPPEEGKVLSEKNQDMKVMYHQLGQPQAMDKLIFSDVENPLRYHTVHVSEDEKTLILASRQGTYGSEVKVRSDVTDGSFKPVFEGFESSQYYLGSKDNQLFFLSDENEGNKKVERVNAETQKVETVIPASDLIIEDAYKVKNHLVLVCLKDVTSVVRVFDLKGEFIQELELPGIGTPSGFTGSDDQHQIFYTFASFIQPNSLYAFDLDTFQSKTFKSSVVNYDVSDYVTEQIFAKSKDGTMVPAFVTHKKGMERNGENPTMLYAYGGFNIAIQPRFNPAVIYFVEKGGIHVEANLRGGSEYGQSWHEAGMLLGKQNVFDDFIAVAEYLIQDKYTSKDYLAISGRSNGGLLMGAVMNQRPDLFSVVLPSVGVMDMLRYHLFTIGWGWVVEYGYPEDETQFRNLIKYSPLHNIEAKDYPATMVLTADHDDRVVPAHSFKYIARLQEMNTSDQPVIIRIDKNSGHGAGKSTDKWMKEEGDKFAFIFRHIGGK